jgi:hypothetical protein
MTLYGVWFIVAAGLLAKFGRFNGSLSEGELFVACATFFALAAGDVFALVTRGRP